MFIKKLKKLFEKITGYTINRTEIGIILSNKKEVFQCYSRRIFYLDINKIISSYGFGYGDKGFHPLKRLLVEFKKNNKLKYEESVIKRYLEYFTPKNLNDIFLDDSNFSNSKLSEIKYPKSFNPLRVNIMPMPWSDRKDIRIYEKKLVQKKNNIEGEGHFYRTLKTYNSIKKNGYKPELLSDRTVQHGFIRGIILKNKDDYRFIVTGGYHRTAALSVLGWKQIPVILEPASVGIVDIKNIENWVVIKEGIYDIKAGTRVFNSFFEDNGVKKAKKFGII